MPHGKPVAVVTGANRGLGLAVSAGLARLGHTVVMGCRGTSGEAAAAPLLAGGLDVVAQSLDITDPGDVRALTDLLVERFGRVDALVNNAGVLLEQGRALRAPISFDAGSSTLALPVDIVRRAFEVNLYGPFRMIQALIPLMLERRHGRVVNISSAWGRFSDPEFDGGMPAYRMSKAALNNLTLIFAKELAGTGILVNAADPGWVRTRMGGPDADREPEAAADTAIWLATLPGDAPSGALYRDRRAIPW
jgi:NAD(P)-dependent dehydrogenase (short-subunit alcohol dehydrogenase family)